MGYEPLLLYCVTRVEITARCKYKIQGFVSPIVFYFSSPYEGVSNSGYRMSKIKMTHEQEPIWQEALLT